MPGYYFNRQNLIDLIDCMNETDFVHVVRGSSDLGHLVQPMLFKNTNMKWLIVERAPKPGKFSVIVEVEAKTAEETKSKVKVV